MQDDFFTCLIERVNKSMSKALPRLKTKIKTMGINAIGVVPISNIIISLNVSILVSGALQLIFKTNRNLLMIPIYALFTGIGFKITLFLFIVLTGFIYLSNKLGNEHPDEHDDARNLTRSGSGVQGTGKLMEGKEEIGAVFGLHDVKDDYDGFVIGKVDGDEKKNKNIENMIITRSEKKMAEKYLSNRNVLIIGSPGTMKSAGTMIQNILECGKRGESVFVTDPKGELCDNTYPYLKELGYDIKIFNLVRPWDSHGWNFMEWLSGLGREQEDWVNKIGAMIIKNTDGDENSGFWGDLYNVLLKAVMSLLLEIASPAERIKDKRVDEMKVELDTLRAQRNTLELESDIDAINARIESVIAIKVAYLNDSISKLDIKISTEEDKLTKQRLINAKKRLELFKNDEMLMPNYNNDACNYEPLTIAEVKSRLLNLGTCMKILQYPAEAYKEVDTSKFEAISSLGVRGKTLRLLFELMFSIPERDRIFTILPHLFSLSDMNTSIAYKYFNNFKESQPSVKTSAKIGLITRLSAFNQKDICRMTSVNEIDLEKPGKEKCAYYCIISDQETSLSYISSLFITIAFSTLQTLADRREERKLERKVQFFLDEFSNIGYIPDFTVRLSTLRSRDIHMIVAIQNIPQLLQRYEENLCKEISGDCDLLLFLGCGNEDVTPEFVSTLLGVMTTTIEQVRTTQHMLSPLPDPNVTKGEQHGQRSLMFLDEVLRLDGEKLIALYKSQRPLIAKKYPWFERPDYKKLQKLVKKHPRISGNPIEKDEELDIDAFLNSLIDKATHKVLDKHPPERLVDVGHDMVKFYKNLGVGDNIELLAKLISDGVINYEIDYENMPTLNEIVELARENGFELFEPPPEAKIEISDGADSSSDIFDNIYPSSIPIEGHTGESLDFEAVTNQSESMPSFDDSPSILNTPDSIFSESEPLTDPPKRKLKKLSAAAKKVDNDI